jgi:hypothetical protein
MSCLVSQTKVKLKGVEVQGKGVVWWNIAIPLGSTLLVSGTNK